MRVICLWEVAVEDKSDNNFLTTVNHNSPVKTPCSLLHTGSNGCHPSHILWYVPHNYKIFLCKILET